MSFTCTSAGSLHRRMFSYMKFSRSRSSSCPVLLKCLDVSSIWPDSHKCWEFSCEKQLCMKVETLTTVSQFKTSILCDDWVADGDLHADLHHKSASVTAAGFRTTTQHSNSCIKLCCDRSPAEEPAVCWMMNESLYTYCSYMEFIC